MDVINLLSVAILIGCVFTAAFFQLSAIIWTAGIGVVLVALSVLGWLSIGTFIIAWLVFLAAAGFANLSQLRQRYIVAPQLKKLQSQIPTISPTEREAIEAGNTWWERELFSGRPHWKQLFSIPKPTLSAEEQSFLDNQVETLCGMLNDWEIVYEKHDLPTEVWEYLKKEKFLGMAIPKQYGGLGFSALGHSTIVTKIATRSMSAAVDTMVPNSLGPGELLVHYGTEEQKQYYLPRLAAGLEIPCFGLTAPEAGSDATSIPDTGIICRGQFNGKEIIGIKLNWDKRYITLAPIATVLGIAFQLYDPDHLMGTEENLGITLGLIPANHPGVETGRRHLPMLMAFMNGPTRGKDVFIPLDWIIGGPKMAGQGWRMLMECLSIGRSISLPAVSTACGKLTYRLTGAYARIRRQFNAPLSAFEGIEEALGSIAGNTYILESARIMTAGAVDLHVKPSIASAIAKCHMTEIARLVMTQAIDIHAGHGIQCGPNNLLAFAYTGMPIIITVEGANILTRNLIIFGQGAVRCHPYILQEAELLGVPNPDLSKLDKLLISHIGFFVSNLLRSFAYGLTGGHFVFIPSKNKIMRKYKRQLVRMSTALALLADTSLILLGGSLKRRERISARLGDIMSQLYLASAVLKYYYDNNKPTSDDDYVSWAIDTCLYKIQIACNEIFENFPMRWVGKLLGWIVFPFGQSYQPPKDALTHQVVAPMLMPSELRDRLTKYCYVSPNKNDIGYRLDEALAQVSAIEPLLKKLQKAVNSGEIPQRYPFDARVQAALKAGIFTSVEAQAILSFNKLKNDIIKVDEFSFDLTSVFDNEKETNYGQQHVSHA